MLSVLKNLKTPVIICGLFSLLIMLLLIAPKAEAAFSTVDCTNPAHITTLGIPQEECETLEALWTDTNGVGWTTSTNWDTLTLASGWHGITIVASRTNHVHLLITPYKEDGISKVIQMLGRYYVQYFNYTYQRTGTLWEGRYKATLIDSEHYALGCYRYIELNPVRANMVEHPSEYPWSSYRFNALGDKNELVIPHELYNHLGKSIKERQIAYRALFDVEVPQRTIEEIREATNKSWVLGSDYFKEKIEDKINRPMNPRSRGGDRKSKKYRDKINRV